MRAIILPAAGGADNLQLAELPLPELPDASYMLIRLHAAGVNPVDYKMRTKGTLYPEQLPAIPGCDGAGVVESTGSAVTRFKSGDEVYFFNGGVGGLIPGNYAEYTVLHEDYAARKPSNLSMQEAAAAPLVLITAWETLFGRLQLHAGEHVLIHAGAGGVGHIAVQLAALTGAQVAATVSSTEKADFVCALGASHAINYRDTDFVQAALAWTEQRGVDAVMDNVGGDLFCQSLAALKVYGKIATLLEPVCDENAIKLAKLRNLSLCYELMLTPMLLNMPEARQAQTRILEQCSKWFEQGRLKIKLSKVLPLEQAAEAQRLLESGHCSGKIVLDTL